MEYNTPSSYKNYLPSKKIQRIIIALLVIGIGYAVIPGTIRWIKNRETKKLATNPLLVTLPTGDPTSRDTDGDGIPDWQEILVGLDPYNKTTKRGTPDAEAFETLKNTLGSDLFNEQSSRITDTDKLSLTLFDTFSKNSAGANGITAGAAQVITEQELSQYILAQRSTVSEIKIENLTIVEATLVSNQSYIQKMKTVTNDGGSFDTINENISNFLDEPSEADISAVRNFINTIDKKVPELITIEVPRPIAQNHLTMINSLKGISQILGAYNPRTNDELQKTSTAVIVQDYFITFSKSLGYYSIYGSMALDKKGYE